MSCTCVWTDQAFTVAELRKATRCSIFAGTLGADARQVLAGLRPSMKLVGISTIAAEFRPLLAQIGKVAVHDRARAVGCTWTRP